MTPLHVTWTRLLEKGLGIKEKDFEKTPLKKKKCYLTEKTK